MTRRPRAAPARQVAVFAPEPMTPRVVEVAYPAGATLAELLTAAVRHGALDARDLGRTEIWIDGEPIVDREAGLDIVPQTGQIVNVAVMARGGGRGGNKALQAVLQIAIMAAAFYIGGPAAAGATGAKAVAFKVAAAAVAVGGQMAVAAAFAPHVDKLDDRPAYSLSSQSNSPRPYQQMPLAFGQGRVVFDLASSAFTSTIGDDVYITGIYGLHYGPCTLADPKLGGTLFSALSDGDVTFETFLTPGPRNSTLYPMRTVQEGYTDELEMGGDWVVHTSAEDAEIIELDITFPAGLLFSKDNGKILPQEVQGRVEYSPAGEDAWVAAPIGAYYTRTGALVPAGDWYVQDRSKRTVRRTLTFKPAEKGQYDVRIKAWDPDGDDVDASTNTTTWTAMRSIENKAPIADENLSILVARFKATNTVNGALPALSGVVTPICPVVEDDSWTGDATVYSEAWQPTNNAAAHARYMVTGYPAARPLSAAQIDVSFVDAYNMIEERDWRGQVLVQENASQQDVLIKLGFMGRFSTYWNGRKLCAVTDWEKPAPRQLFSGLNAQGYSYSRAFPEEIHGVTVRFGNLDQDGLSDELTVYADGYDKTTANLIEVYDLPFKTTAVRAYKEGRVWLAKRLYQSETHSWSAGFDGLVSTYGDRVLVRHASTLFGQAESRVQNRRWSGALVSGVRLDDPVEMVAGKTYALDVRRPDGDALRNLLVVTTPGRVRDLVFATPLAEIDAPGRDDLVVFGEVDIITEDVEIIDVAPSSSRSVALRAQPYRFEDILAAETGPIPPLQTRLTARSPAPQPRILASQGSPDGVLVAFDVATSRTSPIASFSARWRVTPSELDPAPAWQTLDPLRAEAREVRTPALPDSVFDIDDEGRSEAEIRVDVEIRSVLANGDISRPGVASGVLVQRGIGAPKSFTAYGIKRTAIDGSSHPALVVGCEPVTAGQVQDLVVEIRPAGGSADSWVGAGKTFPAANPTGDIEGVKAGDFLDVRARWRASDNWVSTWVYEYAVAIPLNALVSAGVALIGGMTPGQLVDELRAASEQGANLTKSTLELAMAAIDERGQLISETFHNGVRVKRILIDDDQQWEEGDKTFWARMGLMALLAPSGNAMIMRHDTLMWSTTETVADHVEAIRTQIGTDIASFNTQIRTWVNTSSAGVLWINQLEANFGNNFRGSITQTASVVSGMGATYTVATNVNGLVAGLRLVNTGATSAFLVSAAEIGFSNGTTTLYPLAIVGGIVKATNFEVDRVKANSITAASIVVDSILYYHIADGNVQTGHIVDRDVTDSSISASGVGITLSVGSWTTLRTVYRTTGAGRLEVRSQATIGSASTDSYVSFRVLVDNVEFDSWPKYVKGGAYDRSVSDLDVTPGAGPHTIELQAMLEPGSGAASSVNHRLAVTEHKTER
ncbi:hypothetical protein [Caulobacter sp. 1776]|uniref:TipJ family phage tail tip protein n=1 Tax=Caulobacter sp. 1776 TaxID=3156420 RepID=UPI0033998B0D